MKNIEDVQCLGFNKFTKSYVFHVFCHQEKQEIEVAEKDLLSNIHLVVKVFDE